MASAETGDRISRRRLTLATLLVYAAARVVTTAFVLEASERQVPYLPWTGTDGVDLLDMSVLWDGSWYRIIAEEGYPSELPVAPDGNVRQNPWAFYPLFPALSRAVMVLTGADFRLAASLVALTAGGAAAVLLVRLFSRYAPVPVAMAAMALWATQPAAPTMQIAYTESLATLVLIALLTALIDRKWVLVAGFAVILGLTRPIALPVTLVVGVVVLWEAWQWWSQRASASPRDLAGPVGALVVTGLSGLIWPTVAGLRTGVPDAYTQTMSAWRSGHEIVPFRPWVDNTAFLLFSDTDNPRLFALLSVLALAVVLVAAAVGPWAARLPMELRLWMLAYPAYLGVVLDVGTSLIRYAVPLFPIALILVGGGLRRIPRWWPVLAAALIALSIWAQWHWTMGLLVFEPPQDLPP